MLGGMVVDVRRTYIFRRGRETKQNSTLVAKIDRSGTKKIMSVSVPKKKRNGEENFKKWIARW